jgi:syntaxin 16
MTSPKTALPPQWVDDVDAVHTELSEIVRMMDILQSLHASRVGSVFGKDLDDMEGRIEKLTQDITGECSCSKESFAVFLCGNHGTFFCV